MRQITARDMDGPPQGGRPPLHPFRTMEIGDSFFAPGKTPHGMQNCGREYRPMRFRCKTVVRGGIKGTRVWRVE